MESYDYVIAGAGAAGCVLGARLSEDPGVSVLVVEAGGKGRHPNIAIPAAFAKQFKTKLDWDLATEPEPHCNGRSLYIPRGKGLGGSTSMNAMLYVRGRAMDYDMWEAEGATGWNWENTRPYFLQSECNTRGASEHHGADGPLKVADQRSPRKLTHQFVAAAQNAGYKRVDDYNGYEQDGVSYAQVLQHNGRRSSAHNAYLKPAMKRPNLTVMTGAHVHGIEFDGDRAVGLRLARGRRGAVTTVRADREVILSGGTFGSAQMLMLSGIGPADHLRDLGIDVREDLPVGENLQDHPYMVSVFDVTTGGSLLDAEHPKYLAEWLLRGTGPLTSSVGEAFLFTRSRPGLAAPDLQFHVAPAYFVDHGFAEYDGHALTFGPVLVSTKSRGNVRLRSTDPTAKPRILTNTLADPDDLASLVAGLKIAREIAATEPLRSILGKELHPGSQAVSDQDLEDDVRNRVELLYHPVGTCRMGTGDGAVVDPELRVRGVDGLRVVDASVFPVVPGGNTQAPTIMVAERAADIIRGRVPAAV
jgi:choline dehydrogenase-like flavoprotein